MTVSNFVDKEQRKDRAQESALQSIKSEKNRKRALRSGQSYGLHSKHQKDDISDGPDDPPINILRWPEVQARIPISRSHAHALAAQGNFPKPIKLGPRASGWLENEINTWLAERVAESRPVHEEAS